VSARQLKARVLFVDHASKRIALVERCRTSVKCRERRGDHCRRRARANEQPSSRRPLSSAFATSASCCASTAAPHRLCFVPQNNIADAGTEHRRRPTPSAAQHRVRLLATRTALDGALLGVMRASALASPIALISDAQGRHARVAGDHARAAASPRGEAGRQLVWRRAAAATWPT
jgi:hypothetical protein